jgi:multidrug efflux pump subunit AcrB
MSDPAAASAPFGVAGRLTRAFIASPLTPLIALAALAAGLLALFLLPREEEPQISVPLVDIHVAAPGLRAEDAVKLVTEPLEGLIKAIDAVEHVYSLTRDDAAIVTARFEVGVPADLAILRVHDKVRANIDRLPLGVPEPLIVGRGIDDVAILTLTLHGREGAAPSAGELTRVARALQSEIAKTAEVGTTYLVGEARERIRIAPDPERLAVFGVTLQQLAAKLTEANRVLNAGLLRDDGDQIGLVAGETLTAPADIAGLLLTARDGRPVYVADVATVSFTEEGPERLVSMLRRDAGGALDRSPAVTLAVAKRAGANAVTVAQEVLARVAALEGRLIPDDIAVTVTRDYGFTAKEKADELLFHLGLATLSIVALVALAVGWREGVVVAVVIPVTILLTLFAAWAMGYTLNRVSLFALIFSIGILVDDAIVVIENIARHWGMGDGRDRLHAAVDAVAEVGNPTIVATLTVVAALLPMLFVSGLMGPYMAPIPAVASAAMLFSFFVAVIVTPWLMLRVAGQAANSADGAHGEGALGRAYRAVAAPILRTRGRSLALLIGAGVLSMGSLGALYTGAVTVKLLPFDNKSELAVVIDLPEGASVEAADRVAQAAAEAAMALPETVWTQVYAGTAAPFDFNGLVRHYFLREEPYLAEVRLGLAPRHDRDRASHQIALDLRERLAALETPAGASLRVVEPPPGPPVIATLLAEVYGPDRETRREAARRVREAFEAVPFVVDVDDSMGAPPRRLRARIATDDLEFFAVREADVFDTVAILNGGRTIGYSHRGAGRDPIPIEIARPRGDRLLDERFLATPVPADTLPGARGVVELGDVVRVAEERASHPVFRRDGRAAEMVTAELAGAFEAPLYGMIAVGRALDAMDWPQGGQPEIRFAGQPADESRVTLLWDGEWEVTYVTFRDMGAAFAVALLGIYILVVAQFGSFRVPLVVLTPVPLTFVGIMGGHWLFGAPFSATSMIGFIALAGIIVRNSILLVDFIRHEGRGEASVETLLAAGAVRFRPILLTALAAMIGAAVILFDPIFQGLAISLLFGLLSSTLLTVLAIPAIYRVLRT